ncbi:histidine phosphatase family protein [Mesorhizobium japonicum]|uniref:histidine phosphatase family protein n=1 Tax=Mesorhizobium japonicum TaxID=2066070 RepID=UPI003B5CA8A1
MTFLYLVRHGETDWNRQRRIQGRTDIPLNATGREQARATGMRLASRAWDGIVASPLERARETATLIAGEVGLGDPALVAALVERDYGEAEGMDWLQVEQRFGHDAPVPGRESRREVAERVVPALLDLAGAHPDAALIVVSHGGAIRAVLDHVEPGHEYGPITNGSVHSFEALDGALRLIAFDDPLGSSLDEQNAIEAREDAR